MKQEQFVCSCPLKAYSCKVLGQISSYPYFIIFCIRCQCIIFEHFYKFGLKEQGLHGILIFMVEKLKLLFEKYNIAYDDEMLKKLCLFYDQVVLKNQVMNLTNITEPHDFAVKNILDSVLPINIIPKNATIIDVGAGAGFPSLPLAILRPDLRFVMIDSLNKRVCFLNEVIKALKLKNCVAQHYRAEDFACLKREQFDVCVSRAVASLATLAEYCLPLVKVGGMMIAYKSMKAEEEIEQAKKAIDVLGGSVDFLQNVFVKEIESIRINVVIKKKNHTPKEYPRGKNLPKSKPIV